MSSKKNKRRLLRARRNAMTASTDANGRVPDDAVVPMTRDVVPIVDGGADVGAEADAGVADASEVIDMDVETWPLPPPWTKEIVDLVDAIPRPHQGQPFFLHWWPRDVRVEKFWEDPRSSGQPYVEKEGSFTVVIDFTDKFSHSLMINSDDVLKVAWDLIEVYERSRVVIEDRKTDAEHKIYSAPAPGAAGRLGFTINVDGDAPEAPHEFIEPTGIKVGSIAPHGIVIMWVDSCNHYRHTMLLGVEEAFDLSSKLMDGLRKSFHDVEESRIEGAVDQKEQADYRSVLEAENAQLKELLRDRILNEDAGVKAAEYRAYLLSHKWNEKRRAMLWFAQYRCSLCNQTDRALDVHHKTYDRVGKELPSDLIVICRECHEKFHGKGKFGPS